MFFVVVPTWSRENALFLNTVWKITGVSIAKIMAQITTSLKCSSSLTLTVVTCLMPARSESSLPSSSTHKRQTSYNKATKTRRDFSTRSNHTKTVVRCGIQQKTKKQHTKRHTARKCREKVINAVCSLCRQRSKIIPERSNGSQCLSPMPKSIRQA